MYGSGRKALPNVREWSEALPDVQERSGGLPVCLGVVESSSRMSVVVGRHFQKSGSGQEALPDIWE